MQAQLSRLHTPRFQALAALIFLSTLSPKVAPAEHGPTHPAHHQATLSLGPEILLATDPELGAMSTARGAAGTSVLLADGQGSVEVWESFGQDGDAWGLFARLGDSSGAHATEDFQVHLDGKGIQQSPAIAAGRDGSFLVVWESSALGEDGPWSIHGRHFDRDGTPHGAELRLDVPGPGNRRLPSVRSHAKGGYLVSWESYDADGVFLGHVGRRLKGDLIFANDFENGTTDQWSSTFSPPVAVFTAIPAEPGGSLQILVDASASFDNDGTITAHTWDFGDGNVAAGAATSHSYALPGTYTITLAVVDDSGHMASATATLDVYGPLSFFEASTPLAGELDVAVGRETVLHFSAPLDPATVTGAAFSATADGVDAPATLRLSPDGEVVTLFYDTALPAAADVVVTLDGNLLRNADGGGVDVNGNGQKGGGRTIPFRTVELTSVAGTRVCGRVLAAVPTGPDEEPLNGVEIRVDGAASTFNATTDSAGNFCLDPAPSTPFFGRVDGRMATHSVPAGAYYPEVVESWQPVAGEMAHVGNIYLPLIAADALAPVSDVDDTVVGLPASVLASSPELAGMEVTVPAGSLFADDGTVGGSVGLATVPTDRLPAPLPAGLEPPIVVTVQTDGATNFDVPAGVCFPNLPDAETGLPLDPGTPQALMSYDHDAGRWRAVGTMTVTPDGSQICSDPGSGILAPGWHCPCPPPKRPPPPPPCPSAGRGGQQCQPDCPGGNADACEFQCASDTAFCAAGFGGSTMACLLAGPAVPAVAACAGIGLTVTAGICSAQDFICKLNCSRNCGSRVSSSLPQPASAALAAGLVPNAMPGAMSPSTGDPTIDEILALTDQMRDLLYPHLVTGTDIPQSTADEIALLMIQADATAGGDAAAALRDFRIEREELAEIESLPGNAPATPVRYLAAIREGEDVLQIRGMTQAYGQYSIFVRSRLETELISVSFYDELSQSYAQIFELLEPDRRYELPRFHLQPVDSSFSDFENDGLPDAIETIYGSDPNNPDTDGDGTSDGDEVLAGTDPLGLDVQIGDVLPGEIAVPFELDRYAFPALAGQDVYFDLQSGANGDISWRLSDSRGNVIFDHLLNQDRGVVTLETGGLYALVVGDPEDDYTGAYQFQLWDVPAPQTFPIAIGDVVADGAPGLGAGNIETPGVLDLYTFEATPGQDVYFDLQAGNAGSAIDWQLHDSSGFRVFKQLLNSDAGVQHLALGGTYTLTVGDTANDHMGTYQFQIWDVPSSGPFAIMIGDIVSDGVPTSGAGNIETPGVLDVYTFDATPGQKVFFDLQAGSAGSAIDWQLHDSSGFRVFKQLLNSDAGVKTLTLGGTYTLTIGDTANDHTGTYQFQTWDVPTPDTFVIAIGDVVSDGVPGTGAGNLETPGVFDVYTFDATAGQSVLFDLQAGNAGSAIDWVLTDPSGAVVFDRLFNSDQGPLTLPLDGTYTLRIGDEGNDHVGTYQFQIVAQP